MTTYNVRLAEEAEIDLLDLFQFIAAHDSPENALNVLDQLESLCADLANMPMRGHVPPELSQVGITNYREVHFKPYRVIYEVDGSDVYVHCVVDGRRDMLSLLNRRLFR